MCQANFLDDSFDFVYFPSSEDLVLTKAKRIIVYVCPCDFIQD
jgi:hypothetical protein